MKAYSGKHTEGCHVCGGFPGNIKTPVAKLFQCLKCGFFTCNKHMKGGFSKACPNCASSGKDLRPVMTKTSHTHVKAGGMARKVIAKAQVSKDNMQAEVQESSAGSFGGSASRGTTQNTGSESSSSNDKKPSSPLLKTADTRIQDAMLSSVKREVDSLKNQMESMHELVTLTQDELSTTLKENKEVTATDSQEPETTIIDDKSLDDLLDNDDDVATPLTSTMAQANIQDDPHDDEIDLEALEAIDTLLKEQEQGISLTRKIVTDGYFRVESDQGLSSCYDYLKTSKGSIHIISVEASSKKLVAELQENIKENNHIFAATAFSPKSIKNGKAPNVDELKKLLNKKKKFIAIGEISLDLHFSPHTIELQKELFIEQALLSVEMGMPLFIASKKADKEIYDVLNLLRSEGVKVQGIMVPIVRTVDMFQMVLDHGFHLLLRPEITHDNENIYRECLKELPIEKLLLSSGEEISPPKKYFGRWNSPEYINETIKYAADMFHMEINDFVKQMTINFNNLFNSNPEAGDDEFDFTPTVLNPTLTITEEKLLENDIDADGDELFIKEIEDDDLVGNLYFDRDNRLFIYTPKANFIGQDKFKYIVTDGRGGVDTATVTINLSKEYKEKDNKNT